MNRFKKTMALLLVASSLASGAVSASASELKLGDVNGDGVVDSDDAVLVLRYSVGLENLNSNQIMAADINCNGIVDANDSVLILRKSIGLDNDTALPTEGTQVAELQGWSPRDVIERVGPLFTADQEKTGVLASVSIAQFILESGYGQSTLAIEANNCFGMKGSPSDNGSQYWDGVSLYEIETEEQTSNGTVYIVTAYFRKYSSLENSIGDHSQYLITSMNGSRLRYEGLQGCTDYRQAAQIIKDGGYATAVDYVDAICSIIERWDLTKYDLYSDTYPSSSTPDTDTSDGDVSTDVLYRVRRSWEDFGSQVGAYHILENAIICADENPGYSVFDEDGNAVYTSESND